MQIEIPEAFIVVLCCQCEQKHAAIRDCPDPVNTSYDPPLHKWE